MEWNSNLISRPRETEDTHSILKGHGRKSMPWSVIIQYRLIEARGRGLSTAQSYIQFRDSDCMNSWKQSPPGLQEIEGHTIYVIGKAVFPRISVRGQISLITVYARGYEHVNGHLEHLAGC